MKRIAIFASGSGSNAENINNYFRERSTNSVEISVIVTNNPNAFVIERAKKLNIPYLIVNKTDINGEQFIETLNNYSLDLIVLAGFLWLVPEKLINKYSDKIVNIHPALLPKYGGKGMFGDNVHKAVRAANETETGITIHLVNKNYDEGSIIFQKTVKVLPRDSYSDIASKVHKLEYYYFPIIIEKLLMK